MASESGVGVITGLSPRVRGNPRKPNVNPLFTRSIPASAGEPLTARPPEPVPLVYPRECGGTNRNATAT